MSDIPLKPCPFCGGAAELIHASIGRFIEEFAVSCTNCHIKTPCLPEAEAIEMWNKRDSDQNKWKEFFAISDAKKEMHESWWRGYCFGFDAGFDAVKRAYTENSNMPLKDVMLRMKVAKLTRIPEVANE